MRRTAIAAGDVLRRIALASAATTVAISAAMSVGAGLTPAADAAGVPGTAAALLGAGGGTVVVAHRGDAVAAPENTVASIEAAVAAGADVVELDVQRSADGVAVLMHDWTIDRTTDGSGPIWAHTAAELTALAADRDHPGGWPGARVPTLAEALDAAVGSGVVVMLELKGAWTPSQVAEVAALAGARAMEERVVLASFDLFSLRAAEAAAPAIPRLLLARSLPSIDVAVADVEAAAVGVSRSTALRDPAALDGLAGAGVGAFVYTLNSADRWGTALALGARGIITDDPAELRDWLVGVADGPYSRPTSSR